MYRIAKLFTNQNRIDKIKNLFKCNAKWFTVQPNLEKMVSSDVMVNNISTKYSMIVKIYKLSRRQMIEGNFKQDFESIDSSKS